MGLSTPHLIILLVIVVMIFGTKKLKNLGQDLGSAVKGFKDGMKSEPEKTAAPADAPVQQVGTTATTAAKETIDVEVKNKG